VNRYWRLLADGVTSLYWGKLFDGLLFSIFKKTYSQFRQQLMHIITSKMAAGGGSPVKEARKTRLAIHRYPSLSPKFYVIQ